MLFLELFGCRVSAVFYSIIFFLFMNYFELLILKINLKNLKIYYFNIFLNKPLNTIIYIKKNLY
jgi:hypothetical protein